LYRLAAQMLTRVDERNLPALHGIDAAIDRGIGLAVGQDAQTGLQAFF